jgi:glycerol-3-phosphate acyltransferase PlsY
MTNLTLVSIGVVIFSYLIGSISFGIVVSKLIGISDPRTYGSQNPGATNVLRSGHKPAAILTLLGDALKGWFAVWLAITLQLPELIIALAAIAVFLGHLWPVFFKFAGGKGVATAAGILLALNLWLGLGAIITWIVVFYCFRYSSLAALITALFAPFYSGLIFGIASPLFGAVCVMSVLLIYRHHQNIRNLIAGKETRLGSKKNPF